MARKFPGMAQLIVLILGLTGAAATAAFAESNWQDVTANVTVAQSDPIFDRVNRVFVSTLTVENSSPQALDGGLRMVVTSSNFAVLNPDGTTAGGDPFYILLAEDEVLPVGATTAPLRLDFAFGRGRLVFTTRIDQHIVPIVPSEQPDISVDPAGVLEFGTVTAGQSVDRDITIRNDGDAPLTVSAVTTDNPAFEVLFTFPAAPPPFTLAPGESQAATVRLTAPVGSGGETLTVAVNITSDDPDEGVLSVVGLGNSVSPVPLDNIPVVSAQIINPDNGITAASCADVEGEVLFGPDVAAGDSFVVALTDSGGAAVSALSTRRPMAADSLPSVASLPVLSSTGRLP